MKIAKGLMKIAMLLGIQAIELLDCRLLYINTNNNITSIKPYQLMLGC
jgi:hypothetical protein